MFSTNGRTTSHLYLGFNQEDPIEVEKRRLKQSGALVVNLTGGIVLGKPRTKEQLAQYSAAQQRLKEHDAIVKQRYAKPKEDPFQQYENLNIKQSFYRRDSEGSAESIKLKSVQDEFREIKKKKNRNRNFRQKKFVNSSQAFKTVERSVAQRNSNFFFPKDQESWNNGVERYNPDTKQLQDR